MRRFLGFLKAVLFPPAPLNLAEIEDMARAHVAEHQLLAGVPADDHEAHIRAHIAGMEAVMKKWAA